jgi:hypothetical protein
MTLGHYALAVVVSGVMCSFTDWLFMGLLFHEKYKQHPEVWRSSVATGNESKGLFLGALVGPIILLVVMGFYGSDFGLDNIRPGIVVGAVLGFGVGVISQERSHTSDLTDGF